MKDCLLTPDHLEKYATIPPIIKRTSYPSVPLPVSAHYSHRVMLDVCRIINDIIASYNIIVPKKSKAIKNECRFYRETKLMNWT